MQPPSERPEAFRGSNDTQESTTTPLKTKYHGGMTRPLPFHLKAQTDYSSRTRRLHGTGTTGRNHRLSSSQLDSSEHAIEIEKGLEIEEDATIATTAAEETSKATNGTEGAKTTLREESKKIRAAPARAAVSQNSDTPPYKEGPRN
ncbi:hypothetical protein EVAR_83131_1 [Eumeta japonica]|uniref:Uncharacterized protein n=1 Tax=Eumeta variegata TaxID=151549 RepID=A0A4C1Y8P1_EUMVA|nr:hypothetical protein EVAR_83131_1 [Eumeta japonica]